VALAAGTRLGAYEILSLIGSGGMGEVYRARDNRLNRDVAIKVLPADVAADHDRLARFEREAQVLASLNHPNIAAIHGVDDSSGKPALVMELVEGPTLADRIASGPIPLDEALPIAKQIAEALEGAHEQGIIHRDLKPANIKVRGDGTVKVLDFGLAKALEPRTGISGVVNLSMSPTITSPAMMTGVGMLLGTAAYMSPEQAKGRSADKRSDIWAFGCVLYEMLTGTRAFAGEDVSDTLAFILTREPDWTALPSNTPTLIRRVLDHCLKKDRKRRLDSAAAARLEIEDALAAPSVAEGAAASPGSMPRSAWSGTLPWALVGALVGALAAGLLLVLGLWAPWRAQTLVERPLVRVDVDLGAEVSLPVPGRTGGSSVAISPDGTRLVYVSGLPTKLFTRRLDQPNATELPGTQGADYPFFSPDGQWVGFFSRGKVNKISVDGGAVVPLLGDISFFNGASWGEDGSIFVSVLPRGLLRMPASGGPPETVVEPGNGDQVLASPRILPGGKAIVFESFHVRDVDRDTIEVLTLADHRRKIVTRGGRSSRYLAASSGARYLVYVAQTTLFAVPFDLDTLETRGTAVPVLNDVPITV
jgi:serine/threonine-protein kinase